MGVSKEDEGKLADVKECSRTLMLDILLPFNLAVILGKCLFPFPLSPAK
jgi:hypothetical protein